MSWKVLVTARTMNVVGEKAIDLMKKAGCELVFPPTAGPLQVEPLLKVLPSMDAVLASMDKFNAAVLSSPEAASLKLISRWGVGYDAIDIPKATECGVVVAYTPGVLNETVADYAFSLLLCIARRVHQGHLLLAGGTWSSTWGHDVHGKTLGIIGCGRIGQAMARRAAGFNLRLLGYDVSPSDDAKKIGIEFVPMDQLLEQSDFVSLHAALTPQTRGLIGEAELKKMKPSAYLINTARGPMINDAALIKALQEGWIAGAALDAFTTEPLPPDSPFIGVSNLLITPHQASFARETGERVSLTAAQAVVDLIAGRRPRFVVDEAVYKSPKLKAKLNS